MSRSFKKPVSNSRFIIHANCVVNHSAMSKWRKTNHKIQRRHNKILLRLYEKTFDEKYLDKETLNEKKTHYGNAWASPADGYHKYEFEDYIGYIK